MKKLLVVLLVSTLILTFSSVAMAAKIKGVIVSKPKPTASKLAKIKGVIVSKPKPTAKGVQNNSGGGAAIIKITITTPGQKYIDTIVLRISRQIYIRRNRSVLRSLLKARHQAAVNAIRNFK